MSDEGPPPEEGQWPDVDEAGEPVDAGAEDPDGSVEAAPEGEPSPPTSIPSSPRISSRRLSNVNLVGRGLRIRIL